MEQMEQSFLESLESKNSNEKIKYFHFIGIGGISMSGLAEILISLGHKVSGSDIRPSSITQKLEKKGAIIYYNHDKGNINNPDAIVYTAAINNNNPELVKARSLNIPIIDRATLCNENTHIALQYQVHENNYNLHDSHLNAESGLDLRYRW